MSWYEVVPTAMGPLFVGGSAEGLHRVDFLDGRAGDDDAEPAGDLARHVRRLEADAGEAARRDPRAAAAAVRQLQEYFAGERLSFDLPLAARGTEFQRRVWAALREIPAGATATYGEIARRVGTPSASRAVGAANGRNPIAVIVPCHRVIGADGTLTGYAGGTERKRWLLEHEGVMLREPVPA